MPNSWYFYYASTTPYHSYVTFILLLFNLIEFTPLLCVEKNQRRGQQLAAKRPPPRIRGTKVEVKKT
jgi:hypothetical protein